MISNSLFSDVILELPEESLRNKLIESMNKERALPSQLHFSVFESRSDGPATYDWFTATLNTTHATLTVALKFAIASLTVNRSGYETIYVEGGWTLDDEIVIDSWTDILSDGGLITANAAWVLATSPAMFAMESISHIRYWSVNLDISKEADFGFRAERSTDIYYSACNALDSLREGFEHKTCSRYYYDNSCSANDAGDDGFSNLDSDNFLAISPTYTAGDSTGGGSNGFEIEDGSHDFVVINPRPRYDGVKSANGLIVITDPNTDTAVTTITEIGGGIYQANTAASFAGFSIGKDIFITASLPSGQYNGIFPITDVDFDGGTFLKFDMGIANAGLGDGTTANIEFTHGPCFNGFIFNIDALGIIAGKAAIVILSSATDYLTGDQLRTNGIVVDGMVWDAAINGPGDTLNITKSNSLTLRNIDAIGDGTGSANDGIQVQDTDGLLVEDSLITNWGRHGLHLLGDGNLNFLIRRVESHDNSKGGSSGKDIAINGSVLHSTGVSRITRCNCHNSDGGIFLDAVEDVEVDLNSCIKSDLFSRNIEEVGGSTNNNIHDNLTE